METMVAPTPSINGRAHKNKPHQDEEVYNVRRTWDYGKFKFLRENRPVNIAHIKRLIESFKRQHLVSIVIVNELFEVIDGQHRIRAARETNNPVYYIIVEGYGVEQVQTLNSNQANWTKEAYLHSYCEAGVKPYLEFRKFWDEFPDFDFAAIEKILTGYQSHGRNQRVEGKQMSARDFQNGRLVIPNLQKSYQIATKIMDFQPYYEGFGSGAFAGCMMSFLKSKNYNHREMLHKIKNYPKRIKVCSKIEEVKYVMEEIYNYKRLKENKVSFRYE